MKTLLTLVSVVIAQYVAYAQTKISSNVSPDFQLHNTTALNTGITSRMFFKTGSYYGGGIATVGTSSTNSRLGFFTNTSQDHNNLLERVSILHNGYVGFGNTNPQYPLHLKYGGIGFTQESPAGDAKIGFYTNGGAAYVQTHNNIPLYFATNNANAQMTLTTAGRFGINTSTPVSRFEVKGKSTLNQQGDDAALEVNGSIKVSGSNPAAFVVTAEAVEWIVIDHPTANGNPDAIILVTSRCVTGEPEFQGSIRVDYSPSFQRWTIKPTGMRFFSYYESFEVTNCEGGCSTLQNVTTGNFNEFTPGMKFNVLVIDK